MLSVPSHRLWPPVSLPRCHRHFSSSSTCFACMDGLKVRYYLGGPACLPACLLARSPSRQYLSSLVQSCIPCAQRTKSERYHQRSQQVVANTPGVSVCSSRHSPKQKRAHQCTRPKRLHPPAPVGLLEPSTLDRGSTTPKTAIAQRSTTRRRDSHTAPCPPWWPISSSPPSSCYTSFAPSAPTSLSSSSAVTGRRVGRVYGCSTRKAAVRCTSVSQHSIASMVSTPRDMTFPRYHCAGKSRARAPTHHQKNDPLAAASPTGAFFRSRDTRRIKHPCPSAIAIMLLQLGVRPLAAQRVTMASQECG